MKRATLILILLSFFPLAFLPGDVSCSGPCGSSILPPFIASGVKPNILIILDNSNSMDEDFYGNAVGSYSPASKSVVAKQALQNLVTDLKPKANVGVMTFSLIPGDIYAMQIHNAMPFASYNPKSYCANPPPECTTYCISEDSTAKGVCEAACPGLTTTTYDNGTKFPDLIISAYPTNDPTRARYCGLSYPKTQRWPNPTDPGNYLYYNQTDPFYDWGNDGTLFGYSGIDNGTGSAYSPAENAANVYRYCSVKTGTSDAWSGYSGWCTNYQFIPTDSDWALGFYNWGQMMPWYWVGPTWFGWSQNNGYPQGYLHVPVGDLTNTTQFNNAFNILNPLANDSAGYMSCGASDKNTCSYIVNASNTPTAGTLQTALHYFNGQYAGQDSPITSVCQKNYIIFVTDGLPSTKIDGSRSTDSSQLMPEVITQLNNLQTGVSRNFNGATLFPVKTYVLGVGLTAEAKINLDQMAVAGGTVQPSGHAYYADNASQLTDALNSIITDLLGRVASGSSISILSEGQTVMGANMLQGVFYPTKYFGSTTVNWPGYLYDYWFYTSPDYKYNNIREDTDHDYILELEDDYGLSFVFNPQLGLSVDRKSDPSGSGNPTSFVDNVGLDSLNPIWEAGKLLFQTTADSRKIYTPGDDPTGRVPFVDTNTTLTTPGSSPLGNPSIMPSTFDPCLQGSNDTVTLQNLINYVRGTDLPTCRNRTAGLCSSGTPCNSNSDCQAGACTKNVWKLGDIVYSTPKVKSDYKYCYYSAGDSFNTKSCSQDSDCSSSSPYSSCQKKESVIYVGANDGMLHAFKSGILSATIPAGSVDASKHQVAAMGGIPTSDMGKELWAFIPKNSLPYLRCLAVPPPSSCHLYYNDLSPFITTMVSNGVTKTVLIGGMRLGGGSVDSTGNYCFNSSMVSNGQACTINSDCNTAPYNSSCSSAYHINAPSDTCSPMTCADPATCYNPSSCTGLSSYYALDITDAENPKLLWEFSHPLLGYSYSGPAVIHKWAEAALQGDGTYLLSGDQYHIMFLSGPTDPVQSTSIQDVQAFILTLDPVSLGISSLTYSDLGMQKGFGGRLFTSGLDVNADGYTDFVFFGYSSDPDGTSTGWRGGIGKLYTSNTNPMLATSANNWLLDVTTYSHATIPKLNLPVTSRVTAEQCFNKWYLFAGTGRYFFPLDNYGGPSDPSGRNFLMGIPFTCDKDNNNCTDITSLIDTATDSATLCSNLQSQTIDQAAWQYTLDDASGSYLRERMTTDPTAATGNKIYLTTSEPVSDPCGYGGRSRVWGLNCATGTGIADTTCGGFGVTDLTGTVYLQTSTGAIYKIDANTFNDSSTANRTTQWFVGIPPENAPPVVQSALAPPRSGALIQWIEK